jgi:transcription antitermination factor NusA-like protein
VKKAKVAVDSYDDRIDPVGACVGMKGSRIHGIVRELLEMKILMLLIIQVTFNYNITL